MKKALIISLLLVARFSVKSQEYSNCDLKEVSAYIHGIENSYSINCDTLDFIEMLIKSHEKAYRKCSLFNRAIKNQDTIQDNPLSAGVVVQDDYRTSFVILYLIEYEILRFSKNSNKIPHLSNNKNGYDIEGKFHELEYLDNVDPITNEKYQLAYKKDNKELKKVFHLYKKWVKKAKKIGLPEIRKNLITPLKGSKYKWR